MENKIKAWLSDIKLAIEEINQFIADTKTLKDFSNDIKTKKAVERNIEIIGEAVNRILKKRPDIKILNATKIVATRNRVIHDYDVISEEIIWTIATRDLPELEKEVNKLLLI